MGSARSASIPSGLAERGQVQDVLKRDYQH